MTTTSFSDAFDAKAAEAHAIARSKGWHDEPRRSDGEALLLMHAEISEAAEALRVGDPASEKIPSFTCVEEELADVVIRIMGYAKVHHLRVGAAIEAKMAYNETRSFRHGGKRF